MKFMDRTYDIIPWVVFKDRGSIFRLKVHLAQLQSVFDGQPAIKNFSALAESVQIMADIGRSEGSMDFTKVKEFIVVCDGDFYQAFLNG